MDKDTIIQRLRENKEALKEAGLEHLYLFGSVAPGDNHAESDIDFAGQYNQQVMERPIRKARVASRLADVLGTYEFDLADAMRLRPHVQKGFNEDKISIF